jgi:hypothetical protein
MPLPDGRLLTDDIAAVLGIKTSDWRARVSRGHAPQPDDVVLHDGARRPVWRPRTVDAYLTTRKSIYYLDSAGEWCAATRVPLGAADMEEIAKVLDLLNGAKA